MPRARPRPSISGQDGRRRCRLRGDRPAGGDVLAVGWRSAWGAAISTARSASTAATSAPRPTPFRGCSHTCQAIPENLIFANLGLTVQTTTSQGVLLTLAVILAWSSRGWFPRLEQSDVDASVRAARMCRAAMRDRAPTSSSGPFVGTWNINSSARSTCTSSFRGTTPSRRSARFFFSAGWWQSRRTRLRRQRLPGRPEAADATGMPGRVSAGRFPDRPQSSAGRRPCQGERAAACFRRSEDAFATRRLQTMRANVMLIDEPAWQRRYLRRLDQCEEMARRMGWGRDAIRAAFGHRFIPAAVVGWLLRRSLVRRL